ncbi:MAG TPA: hypothetical protein VHR66_19145 [Gemmataceae bacterium]|nr:hypothetical protein [Gemmataceae bacterium]
MHTRPHPLAILAAIFIVLGTSWWLESNALRPDDRDAMLGTWTDEAGPPGNSIRFYQVPIDLPGAPIATGFEGKLTVDNCLGEIQAAGQWNFGSWDPLVLNLLVGRQNWYVVIVKLDDDHLRVRFGTDPEEIMRPGAINHPDARTLTRIANEP